MEQMLVDYLANATWQIPLLAAGAWLFIRIGKFGPRTQHGVWLAVLGLAILLPLGKVRSSQAASSPATCSDCRISAPTIYASAPLPRAAIVTGVLVADPRVSQEFFSIPHPTLRLSPAATTRLIGFYFAILLFSLYRILASWRRAQHMVAEADPLTLPPQWNRLLQQSGDFVGVRLPQLRRSAEVRSPVIVGVTQPVLLLPKDFETHSHNEVQAAFLHELAHVRRRDYLSNLVCQLAALPIAWHPLTYGVQQRVRRTREMVCDEIAAQAMQSDIGYAKCLLAMAGRTLGPCSPVDAALAIGLFGDNVLEERIMRLMEQKNNLTMRAKLVRVAGGAMAMILAVTIAASFHVTPTLAQQSDTTVATPAAPPAPAAPDMTVAPQPPTPPRPDTSVEPVAPPPPAPPQPDASVAPAPPQPPTPPAPDSVEPPPAPPAPDDAITAISPVPPVPPVAPVAPVPEEAKPSSAKQKAVHPHPAKPKDESRVIDGNDTSSVVDVNPDHALSTEQQAQLQSAMAAMDAQIAQATKRFNSAEFKRQMAEIAKQQANMKHLDFAQIQGQIDAATAKINSPEFKQQMADIQKQMESGAMQRSMEAASKQMKLAEQQQKAMQKVDMVRMQQQIAAATAKINSPEFKKQMADIQKQIDSGAMQRSMEEATQQLKAAEDQMRQQQTK